MPKNELGVKRLSEMSSERCEISAQKIAKVASEIFSGRKINEPKEVLGMWTDTLRLETVAFFDN